MSIKPSASTLVPVPIPDLPADVQAAFDAAVDARRRFHAASNGNRRRDAINDLRAANRVLAAHDPALVDGAAQSAIRRDEAKARVRAKVEAEKALPPIERVANILHATHTTADAQALLDGIRADIERDVRRSIAEDFTKYGRVADHLSWGEANLIAREGLCRCRGGDKPCDAEGIRDLVEGGSS